jgi:transposase InsO family protein
MLTLRSDNGGEYISSEFKQFCVNNKIKRQYTLPDTSKQNGVAERSWRTLFEMARAMLKTANLPVVRSSYHHCCLQLWTKVLGTYYFFNK